MTIRMPGRSAVVVPIQVLAMEEQRVWNDALLAAGAKLPPPGAVPTDVIRRNRIEGRGGLPRPHRVEHALDTELDGVPVRIFTPEVALGVYLHFHGGGWVFGSLGEHDPMLWSIARAAKLIVVTVGYRLAPEHPHPAACEDGERAVMWTLEHSRERFGTDRVLMGGESAGAHVAVSSLLRLRDRHNVATAISAVQLSYGIYDLGMTPSQRAWTDRTMVLSTAWLSWFYEQVTPGLDSSSRRDASISPLYADLCHLPPALFTVGTEDPLLDDTLEMAAAWELAGNPVELAVYPRGAHGLNVHPTTIGRAAQARITGFLNSYASRVAL